MNPLEKIKPPPSLNKNPHTEKIHLLRDLQSHMELEMQNQELQEIYQRLEESRDRYADLYDFAPIGYATLDDTGVIEEINLTGAQMFGIDRSRLIGMPFSLYIVKNDIRKFRGHLQRCRNAQKKVTTELAISVKGGRIMQVQLYSARVDGSPQTKITFRTAITDITELKQAEEALRESRKRYRIVADYTHDWEYWQGPDGKLIYISPSCERITGYTRQEFLSDPTLFQRIIHPEDREMMSDHASIYGDSSQVMQIEFRIVNRDGHIRWIGHLCQPVHGDANQYLGRRCSNRDITDQKIAQEENETLTQNLAARAADLEMANRELEAFSYTVSHDLRSPLTNISGSCQVLIELCGGKLDEHCNSFLFTILEESRRMSDLISTMLDFSLLTHGDIKRESVDISILASEVAQELKMQEPGRNVETLIAENLKAEGDRQLMRVVLHNLIGNAWKYTGKEGKAVIEIGRVDRNGEASFFVRDNGVGLDMTKAKEIFGTFQRLNNDFEGTGIGLATVERIIVRHGGRVWAESTPGEGATFYFTLPSTKAV